MIDDELSEDLLRRFLSGELSESERESLEERILLEDGVFERVLATESDLIDGLVRDELTTEDRERLNEQVAASPRLRERIELAGALVELGATDPAAAKGAARPPHLPWWRGPLRAIRAHPAALAAAMLLVLATGFWLLTDASRHRPAISDEPAGARSLEVILAPSIRSSGEVDTLKVTKDIEHIRLSLEVSGQGAKTYRAEIRNRNGAIVWQRGDLMIQETSGLSVVALDLPASLLPNDSYVAELFETGQEATPGDGSGEPTGSPTRTAANYRFSVAHESGSSAAAANDAGLANSRPMLGPANTLERQMVAAGSDVVLLHMETDHYFHIKAEPTDFDLALTLTGPDSRVIDEADLDSSSDGREDLYGVTRVSGTYRLEARARLKGHRGSYLLRFAVYRPAKPEDPLRVQGWKPYYQARALMQSRNPATLRRAIALLSTSLEAWEELDDAKWQASTLDNIGYTHDLLEEVSKAIPYFERAIPAWRRAGELVGEAKSLNNLASAQHDLGDLETAEAHYRRALDLFRQAENGDGEAIVLFKLGSLLSFKGRLGEALALLHRAREMRETDKDPSRLAKVLSGLGTAYTHLGQVSEAIEHLQRARELLTDPSKVRDLATILANLGAAYEWSGDRAKALTLYRQSLRLNRDHGHQGGEAAVLGNLAYLYRQLGDFEQAASNATRSLELHHQLGRADDEANAWLDLGYIRFLEGHPELALEAYDKALSILRGLGNIPLQVLTLERKGTAQAALGRRDIARGIFLEALSLSESVDEQRWVPGILLGLGGVREDAGEHEEATADFARALKVSRQQGDPNGEAAALVGLARSMKRRGRLDAAQEHLNQALELVESLRFEAGSLHLRATFLASQRAAYDLAIDVAMERHARTPLAGHDEAALRLSERARARVLLDLLAEISVDFRRDGDPALITRERSLELQIRARERSRQERKRNLTGPAAAELDIEIGDLLSQYRETREQIRRQSPHYAGLTQPRLLGLEQIRTEVLDDDSVVMEYSLGEARSFLWVVTPTTFRTFELPPRAEIEPLARQLHDGLRRRSQRLGLATQDQRLAEREELSRTDHQGEETSRMLSQILIGPAFELLVGKRLVIIADGALQYLPFGALPRPSASDGTNGSSAAVPLIVDHEVVVLPSASVLATVRRATAGRAPAAKSVAILADPVFGPLDKRAHRSPKAGGAPSTLADPYAQDMVLDRGASRARDAFLSDLIRLPASAREADAIAALAGGEVFIALGFQASRATAMRPELGNYRYLHFATHSLVHSSYPELSGIVLSLVNEQGRPQEGVLRLHDLYGLKLGADLVVLSACQTALGQEIVGEGLMGLPRGFFYAGAPRVVASLWRVNDQATADLMEEFYRGILRENLRPAEALRRAQLSMRQDSSERRHPFYWAAFVLYGDWQ